jgi:hypothetical protein
LARLARACDGVLTASLSSPLVLAALAATGRDEPG